MQCDTCGTTNRTVMLTFEQRIGKRRIAWSQCRPCWAKEQES